MASPISFRLAFIASSSDLLASPVKFRRSAFPMAAAFPSCSISLIRSAGAPAFASRASAPALSRTPSTAWFTPSRRVFSCKILRTASNVLGGKSRTVPHDPARLRLEQGPFFTSRARSIWFSFSSRSELEALVCFSNSWTRPSAISARSVAADRSASFTSNSSIMTVVKTSIISV